MPTHHTHNLVEPMGGPLTTPHLLPSQISPAFMSATRSVIVLPLSMSYRHAGRVMAGRPEGWGRLSSGWQR